MARYEAREDSHDLLNQYLQEIARIPRLTPEREKELGRRVQENDKAALEELVKSNLRFVVSYAKRYRNANVLFLDLINEGNIGLIHAAKKYDPDKNVDRKSTRLNSSHSQISYAVFCLKKKK